MEATMNRIRI